MSSKKATPNEIHAVMEQQKRLKELQSRLTGVLNKVKETINSITVSFDCASTKTYFLKLNFRSRTSS